MNTNQLFNSSALLLVCAIPAAAANTQKTEKSTQRPNIVLMIADDCRMRDLGCYGNSAAQTPAIDRLAAEGLRFEQFFQATAMSSPTRHCLLTGIYPVRTGAYPNHTFIGPQIETLPTYLQREGYITATQGKRHYAPLAQFPFEYLDGKRATGTPPLDPKKIEPFLARMSQTDEPFFLFLCSTDPHSPWTRGDRSLFDPESIELPSNLVDTPQTRQQYCNYMAEINQLDNDVATVETMLEHYGLKENTIFIFTSEQGYSFPFAKWTCYDEGLQTGFIVRWPGVTKAGSTTSAMCEYVDVTPTLIDIAGGKAPSTLDGKSFKRIIEGKTDKGKRYVYAIHTSRGIISGPDYYAIRSVRDNRYTYIRNLTPEAQFRCASFNDEFFKSWIEKAAEDTFASEQVARYQTRPAEELYDNLSDPFQTVNLASKTEYAKIKARLSKQLDRWMQQQGDRGQKTEMEAFFHMAGKMGVK